MTCTRRAVVLLLGLFLLAPRAAAAPEAGADKPTNVEEIRAQPQKYMNERVVIEGFVVQYHMTSTKTTAAYFFKDVYGGVIKVRTSKGQPEIGPKYRVGGVIGVDPESPGDVLLTEDARELVQAPPGDTTSAAPPRKAASPARAKNSNVLLLFVGIVGGLVILLVLLVLLFRMRAQDNSTRILTPVPGRPGGPGGPGSLPRAQVLEGRTIKLQTPPPGTLKILPGRMEVVAGDDTVKEIRFYRLQGQTTPVVTFGRAPGPPYSHVQFKSMTVSSSQAELVFDGGRWALVNHAPPSSNPTRHNGSEMAVDHEVPLRDGDRIDMGEVRFVFHEA